MAHNQDGEPICHFCKEIVYLDEVGEYYQWGSGWLRKWSWPTTSNHAKDIRWLEEYAHPTCLDEWLVEKQSDSKEENPFYE